MEHTRRHKLTITPARAIPAMQPSHLPLHFSVSPCLRGRVFGSLLAAAILFALLAIPAAAEPLPYFSLSTDRTFQPGEKMTIHLYTRDVQALEFRVYRVNEPTVFFEKLHDIHGFSTRAPLPGAKEEIDERTWIEAFHDWKLDVWHTIRRFFRSQFSDNSRREMRETQGRAHRTEVSVTSATTFAQIPFLNSRQLVARWRQDVPPKFYSQRQDVPLENLDKGVYVIEATDGTQRAYTVLIVSNLALIIKNSDGQVLAFAVDRREGAPVPDTRVDLFGSKKQQAGGQTDSQGLVTIPVAATQLEDIRIIAVHDKDVTLIAPYYLNLSSNSSEDRTGYVYTDRPVYRPGHSVHIKGILRTRSAGQMRVPAGEQVQITVTDARGKQLYQTNSVVSAFGGVHADLTLPVDVALGYCPIAITGKNGVEYNARGSFMVEEYKKPEYEVRVIPDKQRVLQGEPITATIEAKYYFGEPVAGAEVKYVVHREISYSWLFGDQDDSGGDQGDYEGGEDGPMDQGGGSEYAGDQISEQSGKLDANGRLRISIPVKVNDKKYDQNYRIEARVTDAARREISGKNTVLATYGSFQVGVQTDKYLYEQGETIHLKALARDYDSNPVQTSFRIDLIDHQYKNGKWTETVAASIDGKTGTDGNGEANLAAHTGSFLRISAQTPEGRTVQSANYIWIVDPGRSYPSENQQQLQIVPDKKSYKPGDTAKLLVMTKVPQAWLLITTEGPNLRSRRVLKVTSASAEITIPITSAEEPNIYISVAFVNKDTLFTGSKNLKVPADEKRLKVTIEPALAQFKPGQAGVYNITAADSTGKPVSGEFSVGVVDEAIYAVQPDNSGDIHSAFYGSVGTNVRTESSFSFFFTGEAGTKPIILAGGGNGHDRLAQLKPETLVQPKVRKFFPDTALWMAEVRTDQNGHGQAQLTFPDSLTTWRATVRGNTQDYKVGSAVNKVIVRKNLMVRLAVPRFFRQGDDVTVSTIVHNYLTGDKTAQMSLDVQGLDLKDPGTRQVQVATKGDQRQDWQVHAQNVLSSTLTAKALTNEESDAMELTLPVIPYGVKLNDSKSGAIGNALGQDQPVINLPGDPATAAPTLKIDVSPSIAGSIFGALDYLTAYPYGCTEQTMSSFLPNVVVAGAMKDLKLQSTINTPELKKKIAAGLDRLYDFQHEDGGWGWWKEDESMVFMTAYVISGLAQAKTAGYDVQDNTVDRGREWLKGQLAQHQRMKADLRAYVVYALVLARNTGNDENQRKVDSKTIDDAYGARGKMSVQGLAMLGLALQAMSDGRATEIGTLVEKQAVVTDSEASWPSQYDSFMEFEVDDGVESTAYALRLLSLTHPDSPLLPRAAFWLVSHRDGGYFWLSTKQTAMAVFGLIEYVKVSHEFDADFTATVFVNDQQVLSQHYSRADAFRGDLPHILIPSNQLQSGANKVRIQKTGPGKLYWSLRGEYYSADKRVFQNNKISLSISRDYYRLTPQQKDDKITYTLDPLKGDVHSGDVIAVRLGVNGSKWKYLLIEDPIPAGAEFIQNDGLYEFSRQESWWGFWFTRREFHDDRAAFFQTYFDGHQEYVYLLKIVNPGKFRISPASVQPMYQPSVISTTDAATLEVK